jgi:hypothetical protein
MRTRTTTSDTQARRTPTQSTARYPAIAPAIARLIDPASALAFAAMAALGLGTGSCGGDAGAPDELASAAQSLVDTSPNGFAMQRWLGAWGSDGPIFTGDLNGDGKTDVFMWRDSDKSWTVNLSSGAGFAMQRWVGAWGSDGPIFTGDLNGDGKTDVYMWRGADSSWTVNLSGR